MAVGSILCYISGPLHHNVGNSGSHYPLSENKEKIEWSSKLSLDVGYFGLHVEEICGEAAVF